METLSPFFTVIMTTYNRAHVIEQAIESVLKQTYPHFELLVIDNGSNDATVDVVQRFRDERLKFIQNPHPSTSCDVPRNLGIERARGRYITFLDDDDYWYLHKLETLHQCIERDPTCEVLCHAVHVQKDGQVLRTHTYDLKNKKAYDCFLYEGVCLAPIALCISAHRLKALKGFTLNETFDSVADYDLSLRMSDLRIHVVDEPLAVFCETGLNKSIQDPFHALKLIAVVKKHLAKDNESVRQISKRAHKRLCQLYLVSMKGLLKQRYYREASHSMFHMVKHGMRQLVG